MRVAGDVGIAKSHIQRVLGHGGRVGGEVGLRVGPLIAAKAEVVAPQLAAALPVIAERQQRLGTFRCHLGGDVHPVPTHHRRAGAPAGQLHRPLDVLGRRPLHRQVAAICDTIGPRAAPSGPVGEARGLGGAARRLQRKHTERDQGKTKKAVHGG